MIRIRAFSIRIPCSQRYGRKGAGEGCGARFVRYPCKTKTRTIGAAKSYQVFVIMTSIDRRVFGIQAPSESGRSCLKLTSCSGSSPPVAGVPPIDQCALALIRCQFLARCPESSGKRLDLAPCVLHCMSVLFFPVISFTALFSSSGWVR